MAIFIGGPRRRLPIPCYSYSTLKAHKGEELADLRQRIVLVISVFSAYFPNFLLAGIMRMPFFELAFVYEDVEEHTAHEGDELSDLRQHYV